MSGWRVPLTDIAVSEEDVQAALEPLREGWLTMGPRTKAFEERLAAYVGTPHAVTVSSGTAALHMACLAAGLGPGDEVIVPAFTFVASASCARFVGAEPVLCDIVGRSEETGLHDLNIDVEAVEQRITPRTKAVVAVHFCGYAADLMALRELCDTHGLTLIEDCAEAIGARVEESDAKEHPAKQSEDSAEGTNGAIGLGTSQVGTADPPQVGTADTPQVGTIGELGAFSFFSKNQLCIGEGGMVSTAREDLAERIRLLRSHALTSGTWDRHRGHDPVYDIVDIGFNFRLDEPRAALGLSRMERLDEDIAARRAVVRAYRERLAHVPGIELGWDDAAVERATHFAFPVLLPDRAARDRFREQLRDAGVQTTWYPALHTFTEYRRPSAGLERAGETADRHCMLPLAGTMDEDAVDIVVEAVERSLRLVG